VSPLRANLQQARGLLDNYRTFRMSGSAVPEAGTNSAKARFMGGRFSTADGQAMAGFPNLTPAIKARTSGGLIMKIRSIVAGTAALALLAGAALAQQRQTPGGAPPPASVPQSKVNLTLEQRYTIKEIIKDAKVDPAPANTPMSVGATVPANVQLTPMPTAVVEKVPQIKSHLFFVKDGKIMIVDPKDRAVVEAIE
jgi:hypothetical protein